MLLDNVTTILLMAPITITLCEDLDLNPVPILMAIVLHANIGGIATPVSFLNDKQMILIDQFEFDSRSETLPISSSHRIQLFSIK